MQHTCGLWIPVSLIPDILPPFYNRLLRACPILGPVGSTVTQSLAVRSNIGFYPGPGAEQEFQRHVPGLAGCAVSYTSILTTADFGAYFFLSP